jgi:CRISPR-associated protein Cmr2
MTFDNFANLAKQQACPSGQSGPASSLASGFVDGCTAWSCRPKPSSAPQGGKKDKKKALAPAEEARRSYMDRARNAAGTGLPAELRLDGIPDLPDLAWIALEMEFELETPWYSKDDRPFHVLDNPVRKDRVFGVPFMSGATWKGLLRWSCRMLAGLHAHLETHGGRMDGWRDPRWVLHLFGNEKDEEKRFERGALAFYPTWFSRLGFEVINPHSRARRAGTQPIYYEVVPPDTEGTLRLLYAPLPGTDPAPAGALRLLVDAIEALLFTYGFSAKRTAGWGTASVQRWTARQRNRQPIAESSAIDFKTKLDPWLVSAEAGDG